MSLIKCRKCGGPHVTLKCGKEKQDLTTILDNKFSLPKKEEHNSKPASESVDNAHH